MKPFNDILNFLERRQQHTAFMGKHWLYTIGRKYKKVILVEFHQNHFQPLNSVYVCELFLNHLFQWLNVITFQASMATFVALFLQDYWPTFSLSYMITFYLLSLTSPPSFNTSTFLRTQYSKILVSMTKSPKNLSLFWRNSFFFYFYTDINELCKTLFMLSIHRHSSCREIV